MSTVTDDQARRIIAANVRRLRGDRSRYWLAKAVGGGTIQITRLERGENMPGAGLLTRLADALDVTVDVLLSEPKNKSRKTA